MNKHNDTVTSRNVSIEKVEGDWFLKYQNKKGQGKIDLLKIRDVSPMPRWYACVFIAGVVLMFLTPYYVTPVLLELMKGDEMRTEKAGMLSALLIILGFGLVLWGASEDAYITVKHEGGELRIKMWNRRKRRAFIDEINRWTKPSKNTYSNVEQTEVILQVGSDTEIKEPSIQQISEALQARSNDSSSDSVSLIRSCGDWIYYDKWADGKEGLEYRQGRQVYHYKDTIDYDTLVDVFTQFTTGDDSWKKRFEWTRV
jgi:hypothetical protein